MTNPGENENKIDLNNTFVIRTAQAHTVDFNNRWKPHHHQFRASEFDTASSRDQLTANPTTHPPITSTRSPIPPPATGLSRATLSLNGIPAELRDDIFHRLFEDDLELPILIHAYRSAVRRRLRENFYGLFFAGGAVRREAVNMWNSNAVFSISFRYYRVHPNAPTLFIWAFSGGWRPYSAPTSRRLQQRSDFDEPHRVLSKQAMIKATDYSQE